MADDKENAVTRRLALITERYEEFRAEDDARLLRFLADSGDARLFEVWLDVEDSEGGSQPDFFVRITEPFKEPAKFGFAVLEALKKEYAQLAEALEADGDPAPWKCPQPDPAASDIKALVRACVSLREAHADLMEALVLVLFPPRISDPKEWQRWLYGLMRAEGLPPEVRFMVLDDLHQPRMESLAKADPKRMMTRPLDLDTDGALNEIAAAGDDGSAGAKFRSHFTALATAAGRSDMAAAGKQAEAALGIADAEAAAGKPGWLPLKAVVHLALATGHLNAKRTDQAVKVYGDAEKAALEAQARQEPGAGKLRIQAKMSAGTAYASAARFAEACKVFEEAVPLAAAEPDPMLEMESLRMAAYCKEAVKDWENAWNLGGKALKAAEKLEPDMRANSTLPYVGQGLTRVNNKARKTDGATLKKHLDKVIGEGWEKKIERAAAPADNPGGTTYG
jgi:tetratricopeptide (TPR) repeat protein